MRGFSGSSRIRRPKHRPHGPIQPHVTVNGFPRIWLYFGTNGLGQQLVTSNGVFDTDLLDRISRYHLATINTHPFLTTGPTQDLNYRAINELRARNPDQTLIHYDTWRLVVRNYGAVGSTWKEQADLADPYIYRYTLADPTFPGEFYPFGNATSFSFFDWPLAGPTAYADVSPAHRAHFGTQTDGYFLDWMNVDVGGNIDYSALGYGSVSALNIANRAALITMIERLKADGTNSRVWGNRGGMFTVDAAVDAVCSHLTGEIWEGFMQSQFSEPVGGFDNAIARMRSLYGGTATTAGTQLIKCEPGLLGGNSPGNFWAYDNAGFRRMARYGTAAACMVGGYIYLGNRNEADAPPPDMPYTWADEWSCDSNGLCESSGTRANMGWLGMPTDLAYKDSGGCWVRYFQNGVAIVNGDAAGGSHSITLNGTYRRLRGVHDTSVNDGSLVTSVTVPANDGRLLLRA